MSVVPDGLIVGSLMTETGGVFRLEARSAKGLSSSMNGEFRNGEVFPNPEDEDVKSPRGGDDIVLVDQTQAFAKKLYAWSWQRRLGIREFGDSRLTAQHC